MTGQIRGLSRLSLFALGAALLLAACATPKSPTDPATVSLASGRVQLIEFLTGP